MGNYFSRLNKEFRSIIRGDERTVKIRKSVTNILHPTSTLFTTKYLLFYTDILPWTRILFLETVL